jgi:hypothetical protein
MDALRIVASNRVSHAPLLSWREFDTGGYNPTPTIVAAAKAVYAGHSVAEIGPTDADAQRFNAPQNDFGIASLRHA